MKKILLILTILTYGSIVSSNEYLYDSMDTLEDFDAVFIISGKKGYNDDYAKLDCQSYFHKFDFFNSSNQLTHENYISFGECEYLYKNFKSCMQKEGIKCVDTEDIFSQNCQCN